MKLCRQDQGSLDFPREWHPYVCGGTKAKESEAKHEDTQKQCYSHIEERYHEAQEHLLKVKTDIQTSPTDSHLIQMEKEAVSHFKSMKEAYEKFLYQRAKALWLKEGDSNSKFFHRSIKKRKYQQRIWRLKTKMERFREIQAMSARLLKTTTETS
ncbi:Transcription repressor OFP10 [Bienertia sinuspersici]